MLKNISQYLIRKIFDYMEKRKMAKIYSFPFPFLSPLSISPSYKRFPFLSYSFPIPFKIFPLEYSPSEIILKNSSYSKPTPFHLLPFEYYWNYITLLQILYHYLRN